MYEAIKRLQQYNSSEEIKKDILRPFRQNIEKMKGVFIFGTKQLGQNICKYCRVQNIHVKGFIDNSKEVQGKYIEGIQVYSLVEAEQIRKDECIVIASLTYWWEIEEQLKKYEVKNYMHYTILTEYDSNAFPASADCFNQVIEDLFDHRYQYMQLFSELEDEVSKEVLNNVLLFRMTFNTAYLRLANQWSEQEEEYFAKGIINLEEVEVFVDGGGYLGETTLEFIKQTGGRYRKVYFFEPDGVLLKKAKEHLKNYNQIVYFEAGLGARYENVKFQNTGDTGGCVCEEGEIEVSIQTLDETIKEKVTFIKLDVEGFEKATLLGAKQIIQKDKPKIAMSAYHKPQDIWDLYELVSKWQPDYKAYLRHYTPGCFGTDLYFV